MKAASGYKQLERSLNYLLPLENVNFSLVEYQTYV